MKNTYSSSLAGGEGSLAEGKIMIELSINA